VESQRDGPANWRGNLKIQPRSINGKNYRDIWGVRDDQCVAQSWLIQRGQSLRFLTSLRAYWRSQLSRLFMNHCVGFLRSDAFLTGDRGRRYGRRAARGLSSGPSGPAPLSPPVGLTRGAPQGAG